MAVLVINGFYTFALYIQWIHSFIEFFPFYSSRKYLKLLHVHIGKVTIYLKGTEIHTFNRKLLKSLICIDNVY